VFHDGRSWPDMLWFADLPGLFRLKIDVAWRSICTGPTVRAGTSLLDGFLTFSEKLTEKTWSD
jgi:hypothetical protein